MKKSLGIGAVLLLLVACSSNHDVKVSGNVTTDPSEQIAQVENELQSARTNRVDVLSPTNFSKAEQYLREAKDLRSKEGKYEDIYARLGKARAELAEAQKYSKVSSTMLEGVTEARAEALKIREQAEKAGATNLEKPYGDAEEAFLKLTQDIENNKIEDARGRKDEVIKKYQKASAAAEKKQALDQAKKLVEQAKKEDADKYAPKSLELAEKALKSTETFINNNPQASDDIAKRGDETLFYAKRALYLTRQSKNLADRTPEDAVLWMEGRMTTLGTVLHAPDQRDQTLDVQFQTIAHAIQRLEENNRGLAKDLGKTTDVLAEQSDQVREGQAQKQIEAKFAAVQKEFLPEEAEVVRQNDRLIIRVKGLQFASGKAAIPQSQFALLSKVQKAIKQFNEPNVVIEGHTDSVGSAMANKKLSADRANAVKEYLLANEAVQANKLRSLGLGFEKPISTNKTAEGRAQNRRIDIIIEPDLSATQSDQKAE